MSPRPGFRSVQSVPQTGILSEQSGTGSAPETAGRGDTPSDTPVFQMARDRLYVSACHDGNGWCEKEKSITTQHYEARCQLESQFVGASAGCDIVSPDHDGSKGHRLSDLKLLVKKNILTPRSLRGVSDHFQLCFKIRHCVSRCCLTSYVFESTFVHCLKTVDCCSRDSSMRLLPRDLRGDSTAHCKGGGCLFPMDEKRANITSGQIAQSSCNDWDISGPL